MLKQIFFIALTCLLLTSAYQTHNFRTNKQHSYKFNQVSHDSDNNNNQATQNQTPNNTDQQQQQSTNNDDTDDTDDGQSFWANKKKKEIFLVSLLTLGLIIVVAVCYAKAMKDNDIVQGHPTTSQKTQIDDVLRGSKVRTIGNLKGFDARESQRYKNIYTPEMAQQLFDKTVQEYTTPELYNNYEFQQKVQALKQSKISIDIVLQIKNCEIQQVVSQYEKQEFGQFIENLYNIYTNISANENIQESQYYMTIHEMMLILYGLQTVQKKQTAVSNYLYNFNQGAPESQEFFQNHSTNTQYNVIWQDVAFNQDDSQRKRDNMQIIEYFKKVYQNQFNFNICYQKQDIFNSISMKEDAFSNYIIIIGHSDESEELINKLRGQEIPHCKGIISDSRFESFVLQFEDKKTSTQLQSILETQVLNFIPVLPRKMFTQYFIDSDVQVDFRSQVDAEQLLNGQVYNELLASMEDLCDFLLRNSQILTYIRNSIGNMYIVPEDLCNNLKQTYAVILNHIEAELQNRLSHSEDRSPDLIYEQLSRTILSVHQNQKVYQFYQLFQFFNVILNSLNAELIALAKPVLALLVLPLYDSEQYHGDALRKSMANNPNDTLISLQGSSIRKLNSGVNNNIQNPQFCAIKCGSFLPQTQKILEECYRQREYIVIPEIIYAFKPENPRALSEVNSTHQLGFSILKNSKTPGQFSINGKSSIQQQKMNSSLMNIANAPEQYIFEIKNIENKYGVRTLPENPEINQQQQHNIHNQGNFSKVSDIGDYVFQPFSLFQVIAMEKIGKSLKVELMYIPKIYEYF